MDSLEERQIATETDMLNHSDYADRVVVPFIVMIQIVFKPVFYPLSLLN